MTRGASFALAGLLAVVCAAIPVYSALCQTPPDKADSVLRVSDPELEIQLWAAEPLFVNPTCMDIDHLGRVWVCESVNYRTQLRKQPLVRKEGDRILILSDSKNSGKADTATVFYQSPELLAPLGIAVLKQPTGKGWKVYVCQSPDILVFEDADGDGKADGPPTKLLTGFEGYDNDHGVHGILIGPDNRLYFSVGDRGVKDLPGKGGKKWTSNSTDCRAGTIWRCDLDGKNLELLAHNFRNQYEPCVDSFGTIFVSDNDDDGNQQTRICYVMPGGDYGYHPRGPGQTHWHEEQPGVVPKILRTGFGSPTGMCVYEGTLLPKKYHGQLLHADAGPNHVRCYHLRPDGAGYLVDRNDLVTTDDKWFRPSDVCVAPDGSVFVCDWCDPGVGGHAVADYQRGRVFRIAPRGHKYSVPNKVDLDSHEGIVAALASPNLAVRAISMAKLVEMKPDDATKTLQLALRDDANAVLKARAIWQKIALRRNHPAQTPDELGGLLNAFAQQDETARVFRLRALHDDDPTYLARLDAAGRKAILDDPSAAVRREALLLLRDVDPAKARSLIFDLARKHDGKDRFYLCAVGIAIGHHDQQRRSVVLAEFDKEFSEWNDAVADLVWEIRPPQGVALMRKQLDDAGLPARDQARIVEILGFFNDPEAGKLLLHTLRRPMPETTRVQALELLARHLPGKWKALLGSPELKAAIRDAWERPEGRPTALTLIGATTPGEFLPSVAALAADAQADVALRSRAIETLGRYSSDKAVSALTALFTAEPPALRAEAARALGRQSSPTALTALEQLLASQEHDLALRAAAADGMAGAGKKSCELLLALQERKLLGDDLKPIVGRLLRNHPERAIRDLALKAFPPPGRIDPKNVPSIASLMLRPGNPEKGRKVIFENKDLRCLACHSLRGVGGAIGPDLSAIGKKAPRDNLFESILYPSKAVADQFLNWNIETKAGQVLTGLIIEESPEHYLLRDALGKDHRLLKKDVESKEKSPHSLMPSDLLAYMTEDDLVDLVAYLTTLKSSALAFDYWHVLGPFDNGAGDRGMDVAYPPEKAIDLRAVYDGKGGAKLNWQRVKPTETGYVDLAAFYSGRCDDIVSYLYREFESPVAQEATILLGTDDCAKLWINGELVHTCRDHRAAVPEQDAVKVPISKGKNTVLLKINNGNGAHGFFLTILSNEELQRR